jgi:hypothetical protein
VPIDAPGVFDGSVAWGDYNNDGRLDFIMTGVAGSQAGISLLWRNTGSGFQHVPIFDLPAVEAGCAAWGDVDNDGFLDFLITGMAPSGPVSELWLNTPFGFSKIHVAGLPNVFASHAAWGDHDNDGLVDFLITGRTMELDPVSQLWRNTGTGFDKVMLDDLTQLDVGSVAWGDFDNDTRLDFLITGLSGSDVRTTHLWRNELSTANTPPEPPQALSSQQHGPSSVTLRWQRTSDAQTPATALSYNLVLATSSSTLASPLADLQTGFRRVVEIGAMRGGDNQTVAYTFTNLPPAPLYQWSVHALDSAGAGSSFSTNATFYMGAPFFTHLGYQDPGEFLLRFFAEPAAYQIEATTNLIDAGLSDWEQLGVASTNAPGDFQFIDQDAADHPQRLYRLRWQ